MKFICTNLFILLATVLFAQDITGDWAGSLEVQGMEIPIIFHITKNNAGKLAGSFDSPKQNAFGMACSDVTVTGDELVISMPLINGKYTGKLTNGGKQISGTWTQGEGSLPLNLTKTSEKSTAKKLNRPQTPQPPYPYKSEEVVYSNADNSIAFGATFTVPLPDPNMDYFRAPVYPTVLLITGSSKQDRDETVFDHKPFAVIADHLTRQGIAVLRVDDRGMGKTTGNFATSTTADFAKDVQAGLDYLKTRSDVDTASLGLIGHSEGGLIAPMVASVRNDVKFIVLLAGPGVKILDMMEEQSAAIQAAAGISKTDINLYRPLYRNMVTIILGAKNENEATEKATQYFKKWQVGKTPASVESTTGVTNEKEIGNFVQAFVSELSSPWFKYFMGLDPATYLTKTNCAVLALNGEKDIQVTAKPNLAGIKASLAKNNNKKFKIMEMPGLNHLFQHCKQCTVAEYGELEESFDPATLDIIANWIKNGRFY